MMVTATVFLFPQFGSTVELKDTCISDSAAAPDSFNFYGTPEDTGWEHRFSKEFSKRTCVTAAHFIYENAVEINLVDALQEECMAKVYDSFVLDWPFDMNVYELGLNQFPSLVATASYINGRRFTNCTVLNEGGVKQLQCTMLISSTRNIASYNRTLCTYVLQSNEWKSYGGHEKCRTGEHIAHQLVNYVNTSQICVMHTVGMGIISASVELLSCTKMPKGMYSALCVYPAFKCSGIKKFLTKERNYYACETCKDGWVGDYCHRTAEGMHCNDIPCRHHGVCVATDTSYECKCYKGRHGRNCQYVTNICKESRCKNGGTCVRSNGNSFTCHCKVGFQGVLCEIDIDECASNPCLSGGRCIDEPGAFRCSCPVGFNGSRCENTVGCRTNPCQNDGTCIDIGSTYKCYCKEMFTGKDCEIKRLLCQPGSCNFGTCVNGERMFTCMCSPGFVGPTCGLNRNDCEGVVCQNQGVCIDEINGFRCKCTRFWKGKLCNIRQGPCEIENNCVNNSTCRDEGDDYKCYCPVGLMGKYCDESTTKYKTKENEDTFGTMNWLLIVAVLLLLLSLTLVGAYYYRWSRSRRQKRSGASHTPKGWKVIRGTHLAHKRGSSNKRGKQRKHGGNFISTPRSRWKWLSLDRLKRSVTRAGQTFDHRRIARKSNLVVVIFPQNSQPAMSVKNGDGWKQL